MLLTIEPFLSVHVCMQSRGSGALEGMEHTPRYFLPRTKQMRAYWRVVVPRGVLCVRVPLVALALE